MSGNYAFDTARWVRSALERFEGPLLRYAARITGNPEAARDVVQETFLRLCSASPAELDGHLAEWLYTVCRNRAVDLRRKESKMTPLSETLVEAQTCAEPAPPAALEDRETAASVVDLVDALPEAQQEVVRLKFQSSLSYKEIAAVTGHSVSNVGFQLHSALKTLREKMTKQPINPTTENARSAP